MAFINAFTAGYTDNLALGDGLPVVPGQRPEGMTGPCTTCIQYGGTPVTGLPVRQPRVQVMIYRPTMGEAMIAAEAAWLALKDRTEWAISGYVVHRITALQEPAAIGYDEKTKLAMAGFNLQLFAQATG